MSADATTTGYDPAAYGETFAAVYDDEFGERREDLPACLDVLAELAAGRRVLELAVGTGRVALPLRARGLDVTGLDASPSMVAKLREKAGSADLPVTVADMADVPVEGMFGLIFVVWNSFFGLPDQEKQVHCFARVAEHLEPGGLFLIEAFMPKFEGYANGQRVTATLIEADRVRLGASVHVATEQRIESQHIVLKSDGVQLFPVEIRYAYPAELDLMARLVGLTLAHRWDGWQRRPWVGETESLISVWQKG